MTKRPKTRAGTSGPSKRADSVFTDPVPKFELNELARIDWGDAETYQRAESIADAVADDLIVEQTELPHLESLTFAAFEGPTHLATAQHAIVASGHACAVAATGRAGIEDIKRAIGRGTIDAIVVGLPGGEPLIDAALGLGPRRPIIVASCSGNARDAILRATAAGADLVALRPHDVDRLAPILLAAAQLHAARSSAHKPSDAIDQVASLAGGLLKQRLEQVATEVGTLQPFELFQRVLEHELRRARRFEYPLSVALFAVEAPAQPPGVRGILKARAGNAVIHAIRDIDLATELDGERFLVLMPYTELVGAGEVARRIIKAVGSCDPVVMGGRPFPARVTGAVAGARRDQPLSFARLMKDATRALEQARRDGAELAVQP